MESGSSRRPRPSGTIGGSEPEAGGAGPLAALEAPGRWTVVLLFLVVALFAFGIYARSVKNEFVWDDPIVIGQQLGAFHSIGEIFFPPPKIPQFGMLYYRPIITLSYVVDRQLDLWLWKNENFAFHFPVVLFHAINAGLVFLVGRRVFGAARHGILAAFGAGLLFAAHPIHTESVCWMAGRSDTLAAIFLLPSFLCWLAWKRGRGGVWALLSALLFLCGLLVKETAIGSLAIVLVADFLGIDGALPGEAGFARAPGAREAGGSPSGGGGRKPGRDAKTKTRGSQPGRDAIAPDTSRRGFAQLLPGWILLGAAAVGYFALRSSALAVEHGQLVSQQSSPLATILNVVKAVGFYLSKIFVPVNLDAYIPVIPNPGIALMIGGLGLAASLALGWLAWVKGERTILLLGLWFFGALGPSLAIAVFAISEAPVAERYLYLPSVAFSLLAAYLVLVKLPGLVTGAPRKAALYAGLAAIAAVSAVYAVGSIERGKVWASDIVFWQDGVAKSPNEGLAHLHLGLAHANLGQQDLAEKEYDLAIDPNVDYDAEGRSIALNNLGMLYMGRGGFDKADEYFERAIQMRESYPTPYYGIGVTSMRRGEAEINAGRQREAQPYFEKAERYLRRAIELNPQYVKAHNQLAYLLINTGRAAEARVHLDEVLRRMGSGQEHDFAARMKGIVDGNRGGGAQLQPGQAPGGAR